MRLISDNGLPINLKNEVVKAAGKLLGVRVDESTMHPGFGDEWWGNGDDERTGSKKKAVYTEAFWLAPPYGRPRDIDYQRLEKLEKSVWIRMCAQHIIDSVAMADWNIVPYKKGEEVSQTIIDEVVEFFESREWSNGLSAVKRAMLPEFLYYDCGVLIKAFPINAYDEDQNLKKSGTIKPIELYSRDGRSFLKDTSLYGKLGQYWQYSWLNPQGRPIQFDPDEVIYIQQYPSSREPYGSSTLEVIESVIGYMMSSTLAQEKYWDNGLFIGGQIDLPELKDIDEIKRAQAYYEAKLRGPRKYNKWIVTGGGATVKSMPFTPQQMEWLDSQKWFAKLVFAVFKVSPSELGFTEDLNRATGIQQMQIHKMKSIQPILRILEEYFNREIVWKHFSKDVKFEYVRELDLEEKEKQAGIDEKRLGSGLNSVNELRDRDGLEKWEDEKWDKPSGEGSDSESSGQMGEEGTGDEDEDEDEWDWGKTVNFIDSALNVLKGVDKAANVGALSGEAGFVPMPEAYGPVKTEEEEQRILEEAKEYWNKIREEAKKKTDGIFKEVMKGGEGSGIKGHKTWRPEALNFTPEGIMEALKEWNGKGSNLEEKLDVEDYEVSEKDEDFVGDLYEKYLDKGKSIPEKFKKEFNLISNKMLLRDEIESSEGKVLNATTNIVKPELTKEDHEKHEKISKGSPKEYSEYLSKLNVEGLRKEQLLVEKDFPEVRSAIDGYIGAPIGSDSPKGMEEYAKKAFSSKSGEAEAGLLKTYMITQSYLRRKHPDGEMKIYRGVHDNKLAKEGEEKSLGTKFVSSWSESQEVASCFTSPTYKSFVLEATAPVGKVLYHSEIQFREGVGDNEIILLGKEQKGKVVEVSGSEDNPDYKAEKVAMNFYEGMIEGGIGAYTVEGKRVPRKVERKKE